MKSLDVDRAEKMAEAIALECVFLPHSDSGKTTEQACQALNLPATVILKTLILVGAGNEGETVGVILLGHQRLDIKRVQMLSGIKKLRFANADEVVKTTSFSIGGVPPMAINSCRYKYIDSNVVACDFVIGAGGSQYCGMKFNPRDLAQRMGLQICEIIKT